MKSKLLLFNAIIIVSLFLISNNLKAVDRSESKPVQKDSRVEVMEINHSKTSTLGKKMSFGERLKMIKEVRKEVKKVKKNTKSDTPMVILFILAIILPPAAVGIYTNWGEPTLWNLLFTILFWFPGVIHAFYILLR